MRLFLAFAAGVSICLGQSLSIGAIGGIRATDDLRGDHVNQSNPYQTNVTGGTSSESKRYVVGPVIEFGLPLHLALELDALYRRQGYRSDLDISLSFLANSALGPYGGTLRARERADSWELPVLLKYKFPVRTFQPYVEAGYEHRMIHGVTDADQTVYLNTAFPPHRPQDTSHSRSDTTWPDSDGVVTGIGVQFGFGRLLMSPEVRYTWWSSTAVRGKPAIGGLGQFGIGPSFASARNQVDLQLELRWELRCHWNNRINCLSLWLSSARYPRSCPSSAWVRSSRAAKNEFVRSLSQEPNLIGPASLPVGWRAEAPIRR